MNICFLSWICIELIILALFFNFGKKLLYLHSFISPISHIALLLLVLYKEYFFNQTRFDLYLNLGYFPIKLYMFCGLIGMRQLIQYLLVRNIKGPSSILILFEILLYSPLSFLPFYLYLMNKESVYFTFENYEIVSLVLLCLSIILSAKKDC